MSKLQDFQTVFRITTQKKKKNLSLPSTYTSATANATTANVDAFNVNRDTKPTKPTPPSNRKSHRKSRNGCRTCKDRHVKCDETRPRCLKCRLHGVECDYMDTKMTNGTGGVTVMRDASEALRLSSTDVSGGTTRIASHVLDPATATIAAATVNSVLSDWIPNLDQVFGRPMPQGMTGYLETLQHFQTHTCQTVTSNAGQEILGTSVLAIAAQNDYLMHAILGTAAAHLAFLAFEPTLSSAYRRHRQAEAYHWRLAIRGFREALSESQQGAAHNGDALISTSMMFGIHLYLASNAEPAESFIARPPDVRAEALQWLKLQSGFRLVIGVANLTSSGSVWSQLFEQADPSKRELVQDAAESECAARDFIGLCGLDGQSEQDGDANANAYRMALRDLFALHRLTRLGMDEFAQYVAFTGRLGEDFLRLLFTEDPAALLILAHWLALVGQLDLWWMRDRVQGECRAIIRHLQHHQDPRIQRLLEFPTSICGNDNLIRTEQILT